MDDLRPALDFCSARGRLGGGVGFWPELFLGVAIKNHALDRRYFGCLLGRR